MTNRSATNSWRPPAWLWDVLDCSPLSEGSSFTAGGRSFTVQGGIPRAAETFSRTQAQTKESFGFKWKKRDTFDSPASLARMRAWLESRYGHWTSLDWISHARPGTRPLLLDAGCGAGMSALELFDGCMERIRYLGVDLSPAVEVARDRAIERRAEAAFIQCDLQRIPLRPGSVDAILSEGVLHHTDSTREALRSLVPLLRPGGTFMFYVYRRKGPIREFTDDYIRERLATMTPEDAWDAMMPLTRLGDALGKLGAVIDIPETVELLGIPAGRMDVQRLFYWHVAKMFHRPDLTLEEMNHINFDWDAPANAHRQSPEEVRAWCQEAGLEIQREAVEEAGITVLARRIG